MNPTAQAVQEANPLDLPLIEAAVRYLRHYGYLVGQPLTAAVAPAAAVAAIAEAAAEFQRRAGLVDHGKLCKDTLRTMSRPRCGCLDVERVSAQPARWSKRLLTYYVQDHVRNLPVPEQLDIIQAAWDQWSAVANIKAQPATSAAAADIVISTGQGQAQGFDGPGGTLAWAYLPTGDDAQLLMRFDIDETWLEGTGGAGILMLNVATHEFGHLLGLAHSQVSSALMAPFYSVTIAKPQPSDDIPRIQALYGPARPPVTPPAPPPAGKLLIQLEVEGLSAVSIPGYKLVPA